MAWGLRDYGTATWDGGYVDCDHKVGRFTSPHSEIQGSNAGSGDMQAKDVCPKCGAIRIDDQIGLEQTPEAYVQRMVEVFREVRRILRPDGICWGNWGDSYSGSGSPGGDFRDGKGGDEYLRPYNRKGNGLKPKDLCGIPWRVALALQADGWWLRQDIIWHKPSPMPESVTDRCTKAHEYVFLLTKSARYFYDAEAIKEKSAGVSGGARFGKTIDAESDKICQREYERPEYNYRNKRSVWTVTTKPFSGAHFATFPPDLILPMILAGTSAKGCCPGCGAPWERVVERINTSSYEYHKEKGLSGYSKAYGDKGGNQGLNYGGGHKDNVNESKTIGWRPTCTCPEHDPHPCIVFDPFLGSGTTAEVARMNGRIGLGMDLNPAYEPLIVNRTRANDKPLEVYF